MAALNPKAAAFDPGQVWRCYSSTSTTSSLSLREVADEKISARYNLDGCYSNGARHRGNGRCSKSDPGPLPTIYEEGEPDELETSIDVCLNGDHYSTHLNDEAEDVYDEEELDTYIDDCQNDEYYSGLETDATNTSAPHSVYTACVIDSEKSLQALWASNPEAPESSVQYSTYHSPTSHCYRYAAPHDDVQAPHSGYDYTVHPPRYDWSSYPNEVPSQVIQDHVNYERTIPSNWFPFPIEGPAQFILNHSMYSPKYIDVGPDADSHSDYSIVSDDSYDPAAEGEHLEPETLSSFNHNLQQGALAEDMADHSFRHPPDAYPVLPMWHPERIYGHSADFET